MKSNVQKGGGQVEKARYMTKNEKPNPFQYDSVGF